MVRTVAAVITVVLVASCSSSEDVAAPVPSSTTITTATDASPTSTATSTSDPAYPASTLADSTMTIECDTDSGENPTFEIPLGTQVTLVATSSIEREFHLHGYDIELTGTEVTFQFTATLPGPHELTEHPDHSVVCSIMS